MDTEETPSESWYESLKHFELIPGETPGTQPWLIGFTQIFYLGSLYFLTNYMENRKAWNLKTFTAVHKFTFL